MQPFFAYMLRCSDGSFYVGHTDELEKRVAQHQHGELGGHTASRRPVELVWSQELDTREEALETELQLKRWSRAKKEALIRSDWATIKSLARGPDRSERLRSASPSSPFDSGPAGGPALRSGRTDESVSREANPANSVRPERSGRAAAAESKDERSRT